jgi:predicted transcriptional regulator
LYDNIKPNLYAFTYKLVFLIKIIVKHIAMKSLSQFVKDKRKSVNLTQEDFTQKAGVALTVVGKIEQGKENLNLKK